MVVRSGAAEERGDFRGFQVGHIGALMAFRRDRQHSADGGGVFGVAVGRIGEDRVDRCESGVAGADAVTAIVFQVRQERADQIAGQVGEVQCLRWFTGRVGAEPQEQAPGVAVGGDGVGAEA